MALSIFASTNAAAHCGVCGDGTAKDHKEKGENANHHKDDKKLSDSEENEEDSEDDEKKKKYKKKY